MQIDIYGIRHHGPGSAQSLMQALRRQVPDVILIEGPPDAEKLIPWTTHAQMQAPAAMLIYNPKNLSQASFFPFAEFSPEWQAMQFGLEHNIPLRFMDLPMSISFALKEDTTLQLFQPPTAEHKEQNDPFRRLAKLAGYSDPERWWDALIERQQHSETSDENHSIFPLLLDLMRALREDKTEAESRETLLREAYMRQTIRQAQRDGFQRIAIVCGAWHGPALADLTQIKASTDAALLKGLKKVKTASTWIPWSYDRLATESGYSAGIVAPGWYDILWKNAGSSHSPAAVWMSRAAQLLRLNDLPVSSAHVIEATRLAETLATLRQTALPGLDELREAAVTVLCEGREKMLELIDRQLVIGDRLGAIPDAVNSTPLKSDFEQQLRSCRLEKSTQEKNLDLDLREPAHLRKSQLLHRLSLLDLPWGKKMSVGDGKQGNFHENWQLKWLPDFEIRLIEAGTWGGTVAEAANNRAYEQLRNSDSLAHLVRLLDTVLKAELPGIIPDLLQKLRNLSALAQDVLLLADAVLPLAEVLRYGSVRKMNAEALSQLLEQIVPRVCIQLPTACIHIQEEVALDVLKKILSVNRAMGILQVPEYDILWSKTIEDISTSEQSAPLLAGICCRLCFDKKITDGSQTGSIMRYQLSKAQAPATAAQWLDGMLHGNGLLLLHYPEFWHILNDWVRQLPNDFFREILPVLRRTFSRFTPPERSKMLDLSKDLPYEPNKVPKTTEAWDTERTAAVRAILNVILQ